MLALIWILAAAVPHTIELVNEVYPIPAKPGWRYIPLGLNQRPARVLAEFETSDPRQVRIALMRQEDVERMRDGVPHGVLAATTLGASGRLDYAVRHAGEYGLIIDNQSHESARVHIRLRLDFSGRQGPEVTMLSPERQLSVILLSFAFFFGVVTFSARRLLRSVRR